MSLWGKLKKHLNCNVEINEYDDGTMSLECNSCGRIIFSINQDEDLNSDSCQEDVEDLSCEFPACEEDNRPRHKIIYPYNQYENLIESQDFDE